MYGPGDIHVSLTVLSSYIQKNLELYKRFLIIFLDPLEEIQEACIQNKRPIQLQEIGRNEQKSSRLQVVLEGLMGTLVSLHLKHKYFKHRSISESRFQKPK